MAPSRRYLSPIAERVADSAVDRLLRNHDERIRELTTRMRQIDKLIASPFTFFTQSLSAASDQIQSGTTPFVVNELIAAASLTLTSTPTVVAGASDGQVLVLRRAASNTVTVQNETILAGSTLRLEGAANKALTSRDCMILVWRASTSEWFQVAPVAVN